MGKSLSSRNARQLKDARFLQQNRYLSQYVQSENVKENKNIGLLGVRVLGALN
jgi:hypothetical protein